LLVIACNASIKELSWNWLSAVPLLHFLRRESSPNTPLSNVIKDRVNWGTDGLEVHIASSKPYENSDEKTNNFLRTWQWLLDHKAFELDRLLMATALRVAPLDCFEGIAQTSHPETFCLVLAERGASPLASYPTLEFLKSFRSVMDALLLRACQDRAPKFTGEASLALLKCLTTRLDVGFKRGDNVQLEIISLGIKVAAAHVDQLISTLDFSSFLFFFFFFFFIYFLFFSFLFFF